MDKEILYTTALDEKCELIDAVFNVLLLSWKIESDNLHQFYTIL
jgi:hypothetical protein